MIDILNYYMPNNVNVYEIITGLYKNRMSKRCYPDWVIQKKRIFNSDVCDLIKIFI